MLFFFISMSKALNFAIIIGCCYKFLILNYTFVLKLWRCLEIYFNVLFLNFFLIWRLFLNIHFLLQLLIIILIVLFFKLILFYRILLFIHFFLIVHLNFLIINFKIALNSLIFSSLGNTRDERLWFILLFNFAIIWTLQSILKLIGMLFTIIWIAFTHFIKNLNLIKYNNE